MGESTAIPDPRAQTLAMQGLANRVVRGLLRTPLLSRAVGSRLVTLYIVGRKSGRRYTIPVAYTRDEDDLLIGTPFGWGRNLRTGEPVEIRLKGRRRQADVLVYKDEADVVGAYATMCAGQQGLRELQQDRVRRRRQSQPGGPAPGLDGGSARLPADPALTGKRGAGRGSRFRSGLRRPAPARGGDSAEELDLDPVAEVGEA